MGARCPCKPQRGLDKFAAVNYERKTGEAGARCVAQITTGGWVHGKWIREGAKHGKTNKFLGRALEIAPGSPEMTVCTNPERREKWEGGNRGKNGSGSSIRAFFASGCSRTLPSEYLDVISWARATRDRGAPVLTLFATTANYNGLQSHIEIIEFRTLFSPTIFHRRH